MMAELQKGPQQSKACYYVNRTWGFIVDGNGRSVAKIIGRMYSESHLDQAIKAATVNGGKLYFVPGNEKSLFVRMGSECFPIRGAYVVLPRPGHENDLEFKSPLNLGIIGGA